MLSSGKIIIVADFNIRLYVENISAHTAANLLLGSTGFFQNVNGFTQHQLKD